MNARKNHREHHERGFTFLELVVVIVVMVFCALMVLPALARTRTNSSAIQCQNNLKQLTSAWTMYSADNKSWLIASYPIFGGFTNTWCGGNATVGGASGSYTYGGADPRGITNTSFWPYIKSMSAYKCPSDKRVSLPGNPLPGQPILRTVSMNSYLAGMSLGVTPSFTMQNPNGPRNATTPVFLKETEIARPSGIFVFVDEDPLSVNDGMIITDLSGTRGFLDLPTRAHNGGYPISFADGHTEFVKFTDAFNLNWSPGGTPLVNDDFRRFTNITTTPLP